MWAVSAYHVPKNIPHGGCLLAVKHQSAWDDSGRGVGPPSP